MRMVKQVSSGQEPRGRRAERATAARMEARRRRARRVAAIVGACVGVALIALVVALVLVNTRTSAPLATTSAIEIFPIQSRDHIAVNAPHPTYNSVPPTGGWHYATPAPWGIYTTPIANEVQVHNLEHGGIVIQYKDASDTALVAQLTKLAQSYPTKIILAPYPDMPYRIALTAWGARQTYGAYDEAAMRAFIGKYINKGPEDVP